MPRAAPPRRPVPPADRDRAAPLAGRPARGRDAPDRRPGLRWLPPRPLARAHRGRRGARQLTLGARHDRQPRFSPDGRTLAFISDRRAIVEEEPDQRGTGREGPASPPARIRTRSTCCPLDGGEARRLTDLPRGVDAFEWSPDGTPARRRQRLARRDPRRRRPPPRHRPQGRVERRHAAAIRLSVRRPARLHAQRLGVHLRQGRPPLAGRRRDRRGVAPDRRPRRGRRAGLVARRTTDRLHLEPPARTPTSSRPGWTSTSSTSRRRR